MPEQNPELQQAIQSLQAQINDAAPVIAELEKVLHCVGARLTMEERVPGWAALDIAVMCAKSLMGLADNMGKIVEKLGDVALRADHALRNTVELAESLTDLKNTYEFDHSGDEDSPTH
jgi:hypothetical protein